MKQSSTTFQVIDFWADTLIGSAMLIFLSCTFDRFFSLLRVGVWTGAALALEWTVLSIRHAGRSAFAETRCLADGKIHLLRKS